MEETRNVVTGAIDSAVEQTGEIASSRSVTDRIRKALLYVKNRQWTSTFRYEFIKQILMFKYINLTIKNVTQYQMIDFS